MAVDESPVAWMQHWKRDGGCCGRTGSDCEVRDVERHRARKSVFWRGWLASVVSSTNGQAECLPVVRGSIHEQSCWFVRQSHSRIPASFAADIKRPASDVMTLTHRFWPSADVPRTFANTKPVNSYTRVRHIAIQKAVSGPFILCNLARGVQNDAHDLT